MLYAELLQGRSLDTINRHTRNRLLIKSPLEAYANQCAGYLIIGTAAARQLAAINGDTGEARVAFSAVPYEGAFWQCLCLLYAGGLTIDRKLAQRLTAGLTVKDAGGGKGLDDRSIPIRPALLARIPGYEPVITKSFAEFVEMVTLLQFRSNIILVLLSYLTGELLHGRPFRVDLYSPGEFWGREIFHRRGLRSLPDVMREAGLIEETIIETHHPEVERWREMEHRIARAKDPRMALDAIRTILGDMVRSPMNKQEEYTARMLFEIFKSLFERAGYEHEMRRRPDKVHK
jgi:hypothetical protein